MKRALPVCLVGAVAVAILGGLVTANRHRDLTQDVREPAGASRNSSEMPPVAAVAGSPVSSVRRAVATLPDAPEFIRRDAKEVFPDGGQDQPGSPGNHPQEIRVAPYPGLVLSFREVKRHLDGRHLTWVGRNVGLPGASFVGVATDDGYDAVLMLPGSGQFNFHARNGRVLVEEVAATGRDCELAADGASEASTLVAPAGFMYAEAPERGSGSTPLPGPIAQATGVPTVDVLFLYNTRALAVAAQRSTDPIGYIDGYARAGLETCNQVLANSRIDNFTWRYVGLLAVPEYPEKVTVSEDVAVIGPAGPLDSLVRSARAEYGADQVLMWVGTGPRQGSSFAGETRGEPVPQEYAVAGLRLTAGILILAHELAHNFGCHHDRGHAGTGDGSTVQPDGDGFWCYGVLWTDPGATTTSGTVMSYADFLVPYFSDPGITLNVTSTLENRPGPFRDLGTHTIGFPETDPRAANNSRVIREHAFHMATLSEETEAVPVINVQPQDAAMTPGQTLTLSVSATGGGLGYQWFRDNAEIAGATTAILSKAFASADAGSYHVRVTNSRGSVVSRSAAVTLAVTPPPSPPTVPPAPVPGVSSPGGGGGGAPSGWFLLALLALVFGRSRFAR